MSGKLDLDHVAVVVRDLDAAEQSYTRLGFQLTPRSSHKGPVPPDDEIGPWGTGNHCAMFRRGYFEILGITDPNRFKTHIERRLARYEGLHLIAFGTPDAERSVADFRSKGARIADPQQIGRDVPFGAGTRPGSFGIANLDPDFYPEADFLVIEQQTREVLWQPDLMTHPNGAVSLESVTICCENPSELMNRLSPILGAPADTGFNLHPGTLQVVGAGDVAHLFSGNTLPGEQPCVVAASIGVEDLGKTASLLAANDVPLQSINDGHLRIGPDIGCGAIIDFVTTTQGEGVQ